MGWFGGQFEAEPELNPPFSVDLRSPIIFHGAQYEGIEARMQRR
jgi:hypothetical protein